VLTYFVLIDPTLLDASSASLLTIDPTDAILNKYSPLSVLSAVVLLENKAQ